MKENDFAINLCGCVSPEICMTCQPERIRGHIMPDGTIYHELEPGEPGEVEEHASVRPRVSTPTAVAVSDRMREVVDKYGRACRATAGLTHSAPLTLVREHDRLEFEQEENLLREIGWLETVIDQRGKRIQELESKLNHPSHRWNFESVDSGVRVCKGLHEKHEDCDWEHFIPRPSPDETRETSTVSVSGDFVNSQTVTATRCEHCGELTTPCGAHTCPPQTRGEEIPEYVYEVLSKAQQSLKEAVGMIGVYERGWKNSAGATQQLLADLRNENSRLLTALEEKEQELRRLASDLIRKNDEHSNALMENLALQSAAVLQQEEIDAQFRARTLAERNALELENWIRTIR